MQLCFYDLCAFIFYSFYPKILTPSFTVFTFRSLSVEPTIKLMLLLSGNVLQGRKNIQIPSSQKIQFYNFYQKNLYNLIFKFKNCFLSPKNLKTWFKYRWKYDQKNFGISRSGRDGTGTGQGLIPVPSRPRPETFGTNFACPGPVPTRSRSGRDRDVPSRSELYLAVCTIYCLINYI